MKIATFAELWADGRSPGQQRMEWFLFLEFMTNYWRMGEIEFPLVVEIGIRRGRQKRFWNRLGAIHLGVDISRQYVEPEILGDSHDLDTFRRVKERLKLIRPHDGKADLLFIDGDHSLFGVRQDFEMYGDLSHMIAIHDIHCLRPDVHVEEFWLRLRQKSARIGKGFIFMEFFRPEPNSENYGIGLIIKEIGCTSTS